jgi:Asp/Glu/hydantoin racemase
VLIGCFGDPGLFALRESSACKVTGLAEASFMEASELGSFAIVTGGLRWKPMLQRLALTLGFGEALLHIETVTPTGAMLQADPAMAIECLTKACQAASLPGVRSIILGGAGLAGLASLIQPHVELPLIDSAQAGLRVLIKGEAPQPIRSANGFVARLNHLSPAMLRLAD